MANQYVQTIIVSGRRVAHARAAEATAWMKAEAPWNDVTGRARAGLYTEVREAPAILAEIIFSHGPDIDYGIWLETRFAGRNSVIAPAIDFWGPKLMQDVTRIVNLGLAAR
jgi:hypothetical protein